MRWVRELVGFVVWSLLPVLTGAAATALGVLAAISSDPAAVTGLRWWTLWLGVAAAAILTTKAVRDHRWARREIAVRYETAKAVQDLLGPALQVLTELAVTAVTEQHTRRLLLRDIARQCCHAAVSLVAEQHSVRAAVFSVESGPDRIQPLAHAGRKEPPRAFDMATDAGAEVWAYLNREPPKSELFENTTRKSPTHYAGDKDRYQSFIRVPLWANGLVFGMLTIDGPKNGLNDNDRRIAELIAMQLEVAFAVAAG